MSALAECTCSPRGVHRELIPAEDEMTIYLQSRPRASEMRVDPNKIQKEQRSMNINKEPPLWPGHKHELGILWYIDIECADEWTPLIEVARGQGEFNLVGIRSGEVMELWKLDVANHRSTSGHQ
ncbi:hypothetical protein CBL_07124 [Carabus blaptoides fortunei]